MSSIDQCIRNFLDAQPSLECPLLSLLQHISAQNPLVSLSIVLRIVKDETLYDEDNDVVTPRKLEMKAMHASYCPISSWMTEVGPARGAVCTCGVWQYNEKVGYQMDKRAGGL